MRRWQSSQNWSARSAKKARKAAWKAGRDSGVPTLLMEKTRDLRPSSVRKLWSMSRLSASLSGVATPKLSAPICQNWR